MFLSHSCFQISGSEQMKVMSELHEIRSVSSEGVQQPQCVSATKDGNSDNNNLNEDLNYEAKDCQKVEPLVNDNVFNNIVNKCLSSGVQVRSLRSLSKLSSDAQTKILNIGRELTNKALSTSKRKRTGNISRHFIVLRGKHASLK